MASSPPLSGWCLTASFRYAFLMSPSEASLLTPRVCGQGRFHGETNRQKSWRSSRIAGRRTLAKRQGFFAASFVRNYNRWPLNRRCSAAARLMPEVLEPREMQREINRYPLSLSLSPPPSIERCLSSRAPTQTACAGKNMLTSLCLWLGEVGSLCESASNTRRTFLTRSTANRSNAPQGFQNAGFAPGIPTAGS